MINVRASIVEPLRFRDAEKDLHEGSIRTGQVFYMVAWAVSDEPDKLTSSLETLSLYLCRFLASNCTV
jgi:hypothetical protein